MTKKLTLIIAVFLIGTWNLYGQQNDFSFGVKVGTNLSNAVEETNYLVGNKTSKLGYQIGMTAEYSPKGTFYVSSGLSLTNKGTVHKDAEIWIGGSNPPVTSWKRTTNQTYLQLPLTIGYHIPVSDATRVRVNAGGYAAYGIGGKEIVKTKTTPSEALEDEKLVYNTFDKNIDKSYVPYDLDRMDYGAILGIGIVYKKFILGFDYEIGFPNLYRADETQVSMIPTTYKNRNFALTVGYRLK